jgi:hypothetical protein
VGLVAPPDLKTGGQFLKEIDSLIERATGKPIGEVLEGVLEKVGK